MDRIQQDCHTFLNGTCTHDPCPNDRKHIGLVFGNQSDKGKSKGKGKKGEKGKGKGKDAGNAKTKSANANAKVAAWAAWPN